MSWRRLLPRFLAWCAGIIGFAVGLFVFGTEFDPGPYAMSVLTGILVYKGVKNLLLWRFK